MYSQDNQMSVIAQTKDVPQKLSDIDKNVTGKRRTHDIPTGCTPRANPRPVYPSAISMLPHVVWWHLREGILAYAIATLLVHPLIIRFSEHWKYSEQGLFTFTFSFTRTATFLLFHSILYLTAAFSPQFVNSCKLKRSSAEKLRASQIWNLISSILLSNLFVSPVASFFCWDICYRLSWMPLPSSVSPLPSMAHILNLTIMAQMIREWSFYWCHRLFHHPRLYARYHKQHHEFPGVVGPAAEYASAIDSLAANFIPSAVIPMFFGVHPSLQITWLILKNTKSYEQHCGYVLNDTWLGWIGIATAEGAFHDHHHTTNRGNFGAEYLDWLFGTMDFWLRDGSSVGYRDRRKHSVKSLNRIKLEN